MSFLACIPESWKQILLRSTHWKLQDEGLDLIAEGQGWQACLVRKNAMCRCQAYVAVRLQDVHGGQGMLASMWAFARGSMFGDDNAFLLRKVDDGAISANHRMLLAVLSDRMVLVDARIEHEDVDAVMCKMEVLTDESRNLTRIEHFLMEGPLASWYHPCCNRGMRGTCEEAIDRMQVGIVWECVHSPSVADEAWDDKTLAFAMSQHARLGKDSTVCKMLDCHVMHKIFGMSRAESVPQRMNTLELLDWLACKVHRLEQA